MDCPLKVCGFWRASSGVMLLAGACLIFSGILEQADTPSSVISVHNKYEVKGLLSIKNVITVCKIHVINYSVSD